MPPSSAAEPTVASPSTAPHPPPRVELSVLFVCLGNICRSPMAEGVFRSHLSSLNARNSANHNSKAYTTPFTSIDSAGTGAYHVSYPPDPRTTSVLAAHDITSYTHSARKIRAADFKDFDYIFAMDGENLEDLLYERGRALRARMKRRGGKDEDGAASTAPVFSTGEVVKRNTPEHLRDLRVGKAEDGLANVMLFGAFGGRDPSEEVGDPYYGGRDGFEIAYEQVERFSRGFLAWLDAATATVTAKGALSAASGD